MGKIFYIMGKSSSGKDTIYKHLKEKIEELSTITLYTTRPIRDGESEGVEYHFVNEAFLQEMKRKKKVIELRAYDTVHGVWKYFTADDGQIRLEEKSYLAIGTLESYERVMDYFGKEYLVPIYIDVEDGERLMRAIEREKVQVEPKYAELCRRFLADTDDFSEENLKKAGIDKYFKNQNLTDCIEEITLYIQRYL